MSGGGGGGDPAPFHPFTPWVLIYATSVSDHVVH